jgi:hypothetical protein
VHPQENGRAQVQETHTGHDSDETHTGHDSDEDAA